MLHHLNPDPSYYSDVKKTLYAFALIFSDFLPPLRAGLSVISIL